MRDRLLVLVLVAAVLLAPACAEIIRIPFTVAQNLFDVLFFWTKASAPLPPGEGAAPLSIEAAIDRALESGASGPLYLARSSAARGPSTTAAPFPGAVPVAIRIRPDEVPPALEARLADLGIPLIRLD